MSSYYSPETTTRKSIVKKGEYKAKIIGLDVRNDIPFGRMIADVYKPLYVIDGGDFDGTEIKDNGLFRYKEVNGYEFVPKRNWGYYKFCKILGLIRDESNGNKSELPELRLVDVNGFDAKIKVAHKSFVNNKGMNINYAVARLIEVEKEVPF